MAKKLIKEEAKRLQELAGINPIEARTGIQDYTIFIGNTSRNDDILWDSNLAHAKGTSHEDALNNFFKENGDESIKQAEENYGMEFDVVDHESGNWEWAFDDTFYIVALGEKETGDFAADLGVDYDGELEDWDEDEDEDR